MLFRSKDALLRGTGEGRDTRGLADIGRSMGMSQRLGESGSDFRDRLLSAKQSGGAPEPQSLRDRMAAGTQAFREKFGKNSSVDKPGQSGETPKQASKGRSSSSGPMSLDSAVAQILKLVEKIEPKLPVAALV